VSSGMRKRWIWWLGGGIVVVIIALIAGPFIYIHFIESDPPPKLQVTPGTSPSNSASPAASDSTNDASAPLAGTWKVGSGSQAGYRVKEVLFGQDNTAVGRTSNVTGSVTISGTNVTKADITVDLTSVTSDNDRRDNQFNGRIMDPAQFPTATFTLTSPV